jgi:predicted phage terminase large subunit-like protein
MTTSLSFSSDDPILRDACSDSLTTFAETMMPNFKPAACHLLLAAKLEDCSSGRLRRLCISIPPRMGKSTLASVMFPAWALTNNPSLQIIGASYSSELSERFSQEAKRTLESERYQQLFPPIVNPNTNRARLWGTLAGGSYFSTGVGGGGLGRGADIFICDDLIKNREEADSEASRSRIWDWLTSTALTRLSPNGVMIVIGSRWSENDVIGRLVAQALEFDVLSLEALCESPATDPLKRRYGESIWPGRWTPERLKETKAALGPREWASHYQQRPAPPGGNIVNTGKVRFIDREQVPDDLVQSRGWDLALGIERSHDYSCGARGGMDREGNFVLTDMNRSRRTWLEQKAVIIALANIEHGKVGIETVAAWKVAEDEVRAGLDGAAYVRGITPAKSKEARALPWLGLIEAGKFFMVRGSWNQDFLHELEQFPTGAHDDQVDAASVLYEVVRRREQCFLA